ncbi:putative glycosyl hydrolase family 20 protein [Gregarina niphandrodes]|uniref:beta-N-acetylhexosaminidase n=1 Tax=Gregarina niphandrodes TaxID=110365 RepID=A0A023AWU1_GRENI|nr:putative glycosyl hydrolase family 20 protein [Gregarina niphandrodes]EZG43216.1 putative glycosyl hydrolase family 20 protein [Gregarina niphandrodes]|eukprot:XP_011133528.1 putative glycosyl hydrolase family 20 protein [Gregarina niphandrodes]
MVSTKYLAACTLASVLSEAFVTIPAVKTNSAGTDTAMWNRDLKLAYSDEGLKNVAEVFAADMKDYTMSTVQGTDGEFLLELSDKDTDINGAKFPNEAYKITFSEGKVKVTAKTPTGALWGTRTLLQIAKQVNYEWPASGFIFDEPNDERRWLGLDCARHYWEPEFLKSVIKRVSNLKMNGLQMHAVDNEAFRYDIPKYPGLAPAGRSYNETVIGDLVDYGRLHGVEVMPGFEFPGHSTAMNEYFGTGVVLDGDGMTASLAAMVTDVTNPKVDGLVKDLVSTVVPWFKDPKYVHLGGDEVSSMISGGYEPFKKMVADHPDLYTTIDDYLTTWLTGIVDWFVATFPKSRPIIYNGFENGIKKVEMPHNAVINYWEGNFDYFKNHPGYDILVSDEDYLYLVTSTNLNVFPDLLELKDYDLEGWTNETPDTTTTPKPTTTTTTTTTESTTVSTSSTTLPDTSSSTFSTKSTEASTTVKPRVLDDEAPTVNTYFGSSFLEWGDNNYWQDDSMLSYGYDALALTAAKQWNRDVSTLIKKDPLAFKTLVEALDPKLPILEPAEKLEQVAFYRFEKEQSVEMPSMCDGYMCVFAQDYVGQRHGAGLGSLFTVGKPNPDFIEGMHGKGLQFAYQLATSNPFSFGGMDMPAPWTISAWMRRDKRVDDVAFLYSPENRIILSNELGHMAIQQTGKPAIDIGISIPVDWTHVTISTDGIFTYAYVGGELKQKVKGSIDLPFFSIGGPKEMIVLAIDDFRVFRGFANEVNADVLAGMNVDDNPDDYFQYPEEKASGVAGTIAVGSVAAAILLPVLVAAL